MPVSAPHATTVARPARAPAGPAALTERLAGARAIAILVALTALAAGLRLVVAGQSLFGDELSTYYIVSTNSLTGVVEMVHDEIEITPPLSFVAAWLATRIDLTTELLRAPGLLAGTAAIPLVYLLGVRTVGRAAGLVAAALTALAPFMIFYSAEARGYQLMIVLVMLSTLALLAAVSDGRARWWVAYAACSAAAMLTHYTSVFALAAQLLWVLWAHPEARVSALAANAGAVLAFLPWLPGFINDLRMPDSDIMSALSPFDPYAVRLAIEHWSVGYPHVLSTSELRDLPGIPGLALQALGLAIGVASTGARLLRDRFPIDRRVVLVVVLALSAPVGEALVSAVSTNMLTARNLAVSWPWFGLVLAAVLVGAGPRLRIAAVGLVLAGFAIGAAKMVDDRFQRPDFQAAAAYIDREAAAGDVVVDGAVAFITPGPLTGLDVTLQRPHPIIRAGAPQQRRGNFRIGDPVLEVEEVVRRATRRGRRVFVVSPQDEAAPTRVVWDPLFDAPGYRFAGERLFRGFISLSVLVYEPER